MEADAVIRFYSFIRLPQAIRLKPSPIPPIIPAFSTLTGAAPCQRQLKLKPRAACLNLIIGQWFAPDSPGLSGSLCHYF